MHRLKCPKTPTILIREAAWPGGASTSTAPHMASRPLVRLRGGGVREYIALLREGKITRPRTTRLVVAVVLLSGGLPGAKTFSWQ